MGLLEKLGLHRQELRAWAMYDWANSAFATTIMAAVLPVFYANVAGADLEPHVRTSYYAFTISLGLIFVVSLGPLLGAIADLFGIKKKLLFSFMLCGTISTALLATVETGEWLWCSVIFIVGQIGFAGANVFYDSLLPHIADNDEVDRVSTAGYAIGYLGGGLLLALNLAWIQMPDTFGFSDKRAATNAAFISVAIWWLVFSIPLFRHVKEPPNEHNIELRWYSGFFQLWETIKSFRRYKQLMLLLFSFWFYSDGISTIFKMAAIFGAEVGIGSVHLIGAIILVQFLGIPFTFAFGAIAKKLSTKTGIFITLIVYAIVCILGYFMQHSWHFWVLAILVAMVQGGAQGLSRSLFSQIMPKSRSAEFFSFVNISGKFAGVVGPALFGILSATYEDSRMSILFLISFFVIGAILLTFVNVEEGIAAAQD